MVNDILRMVLSSYCRIDEEIRTGHSREWVGRILPKCILLPIVIKSIGVAGCIRCIHC